MRGLTVITPAAFQSPPPEARNSVSVRLSTPLPLSPPPPHLSLPIAREGPKKGERNRARLALPPKLIPGNSVIHAGAYLLWGESRPVGYFRFPVPRPPPPPHFPISRVFRQRCREDKGWLVDVSTVADTTVPFVFPVASIHQNLLYLAPSLSVSPPLDINKKQLKGCSAQSGGRRVLSPFLSLSFLLSLYPRAPKKKQPATSQCERGLIAGQLAGTV